MDFIEHFFFHCKQVRLLWKSIENWWKQMLQVTFALDASTVLFGIPNTHNDRLNDIVNYCILYAKLYVHQTNMSSAPICFLEYIRFVKKKSELEKMHVAWIMTTLLKRSGSSFMRWCKCSCLFSELLVCASFLSQC